jgi:GNAT superfamily N-acetyltransferase
MNLPANASPKIQIRNAMANDIGEIIAVVNAAFAVESFIDGTRTDEVRMIEMMEKGEFLVAEDSSGRTVASVYIEQRGNRGYFGMLAVDPAHQGEGLGRLTIEAAENLSRERGCRWMDIRVLSLRPELLPFYEKIGYVETRREEFHPSRPLKEGFKCQSIVMSKRL